MTFKKESAWVEIGRKFVNVVSEPALREYKVNGVPRRAAHFTARGRGGELVDCLAWWSGVERAMKQVSIGDEVVIDEKVEIIAVDNTLEYKYHGTYII